MSNTPHFPILLLATGSEHKRHECSRILGFELTACPVSPSELQPSDRQHRLIEEGQYTRVSAEIAAAKARSAWEQNGGEPVLVEDSSLYLACRDGFPGPLIRFECSPDGLRRICRDAHHPINDSPPRDQAVSVVAFAACVGTPPQPYCWVGETRGRIAPAPTGENGFGWDCIFIPDGSSTTYAQMSAHEKDTYSARARALQQLRADPTPWAKRHQ